jgi:hypothetical protein
VPVEHGPAGRVVDSDLSNVLMDDAVSSSKVRPS